MVRYFFDSRDGDHFIRDDEGVELDGIETARKEAATVLAYIARDTIPKSERRELAIEVRDDSRQLFRAALRFEIDSAN